MIGRDAGRGKTGRGKTGHVRPANERSKKPALAERDRDRDRSIRADPGGSGTCRNRGGTDALVSQAQREHDIMMKTVTSLLAGTIVAATMTAALPASAQSIIIGPDGRPGIDLRSRAQRERDFQREMRMRDRDDYYREQRFRDRDRHDRRYDRRGYDY
ncbi:MAG: hypothetical protein PGN25_01655 [Methylorubrum populi]